MILNQRTSLIIKIKKNNMYSYCIAIIIFFLNIQNTHFYFFQTKNINKNAQKSPKNTTSKST